MNSCTFDEIENDKDAILILKYCTMDNVFLKTMKEKMEKIELEKRASLLSLVKKLFAELLQKEADDLDILIKEHDVLLRACLKLQSKSVHAIAYFQKNKNYKMMVN